MVLNAVALDQVREGQDESTLDRAGRVSRLKHLIRGGRYTVQAHRLAHALLEWDVRKSLLPKVDSEREDRRRAYMREYMRRRRAARAGATPPADPPGERGAP